MAQTTGGMSGKAATLAFSTDGSSWTDCSGYSQMVTVDGGDRQTGETLTMDGDTPIISDGKRNGHKVKARIVYTESSSELGRTALTRQQAGIHLWLRWTLKAATTGNMRYTSSEGTITTPPYPQPDTTSPDLILVEVEIHCADVTPAAIP